VEDRSGVDTAASAEKLADSCVREGSRRMSGRYRGGCNRSHRAALCLRTSEGGIHMEKDVVCGMQVDPAKAAGSSQYNGKTYYFCSKGCKGKFDANPGQFVK
jgi:YHS domain-containing protein